MALGLGWSAMTFGVGLPLVGFRLCGSNRYE
jgi:hypothetical protein